MRQICSLYHRFYFSYPLTLPNQQAQIDTYESRIHDTKFMKYMLYDVESELTQLRSDYFDDKFTNLDDALTTRIDQLGPKSLFSYRDDLVSIPRQFKLRHISEVMFNSILFPCGILLQDLMNRDFSSKYSIEYGPYILYSRFVSSGEKPLLLFQYQDIDSTSETTLKQVASYLIQSDLEECVLTDFKSTLYIRANLKESSTYPVIESGGRKKVKLPFEYKVIRNTDCGITLQAVFASLIYERESEANNNLIEIIKIANEDPKFEQVDVSKFHKVVTVDMNKRISPVKTCFYGPTKIYTEYTFPYKKYFKCFNNTEVSDNVPKTLNMKLYDFTQIENYTQGNFNELRRLNIISDIIDISCMERYAGRLVLEEIARYKSIQNSKKRLKGAELYDYGFIVMSISGYPIKSGYYLFLSDFST